MKYNVEIANFLDEITARLRMPVAVHDNGKTMWVYDYEQHKRYSITFIVEEILFYSDLRVFSRREIADLCDIIPNKRRGQMILNELICPSDLMGDDDEEEE